MRDRLIGFFLPIVRRLGYRGSFFGWRPCPIVEEGSGVMAVEVLPSTIWANGDRS